MGLLFSVGSQEDVIALLQQNEPQNGVLCLAEVHSQGDGFSGLLLMLFVSFN